MSKKSEKFARRKLRSAYFSVVVSISLVLLMLGLLGILLINAKAVSNHVKENFVITAYLKEAAKKIEIRQLQKSLEVADYIKTTEYISKEEAAKNLKKDLEEDFVNFLGYNPLYNSLDIRLNADFAETHFIEKIISDLSRNPVVEEIDYDKDLVYLVNENIEKIGIGIIGVSVLFTLIAIGLINSSIRLSIYSKRFIIKTMQLVGATKGFIRKPFVLRSVRHGIYGGLITIILLSAVLYYLEKNIPVLFGLQNIILISALFGVIVLLGIFISWICTRFAVRKYLKLKTDQLYF